MTATCRVVNPLIAALPGRWVRIEPNDGFEMNVTVEVDNPDCRFPQDPQGQGDPGDACVRHFDPPGSAILSGTRLYRVSADAQDRVEGQVLENGRRVEIDRWYNDRVGHYVFTKE